MFKYFYPYEYVDSVFCINYNELYKKGYRGIIFDIDNTLVHHGDDSTKEIDELFKMIQKIGFKTCLLSNNNECYNAAVPKEYGDMFSLVAYSYITDGYSKSIEVYKKIDKYKKIFLLSKNYSFRRKVKYLLIYLFIKLRMPKRWVMNLWNVNYLRIISHLKIK